MERNAISLRLPLTLAVAATAALLAAPVGAQLHLPQAAEGTVMRADGGIVPDGLRWSAWPALDAERRVVGAALSPIASGSFVGDLGAGAAGEPEGWVALVEGHVDGRASFAITSTTLEAHPATFAPARLAAVPTPSSSVAGTNVTVTWQAAEIEGRALGPDDGLVSYAVLRSATGLTGDWEEIGRVPADEGEHAFVDEGLPVGRFHHAVAVVATGGVRSDVRVPAGVVSIGFDGLLPRLRVPRPDDGLRPVLDGRRER